jgi:hypothetical protein
MKAECQCGQLTAEVPEKSLITIACHCIACQRRTGAPFGVLAYHRRDLVTVAGDAKSFTRISDAGNPFETFFCPVCGSTVYATLGKQPGLIGIAVGAMADPAQKAPVWSVWEQSQHNWVTMPENVKHFEQNGQA